MLRNFGLAQAIESQDHFNFYQKNQFLWRPKGPQLDLNTGMSSCHRLRSFYTTVQKKVKKGHTRIFWVLEVTSFPMIPHMTHLGKVTIYDLA